MDELGLKGYQRAGINVGPTVRMCFSPAEAAGVDSVVGVGSAGAGGAGAAAALVPLAPFLAVAPLAAGGRAIFFALSSVTMMSPCCSAAALSSTLFNASDQVCPGALQAQEGLNSWR